MLKRSPIKKVSSKQAKKNRTWSKLKLARIKLKIECQGFIKCQGCSKTYYDVKSAQEGLEAHHRVQRSLCGEYTDSNMALLCQKCHTQSHSSEGLRTARLTSSL